ncbi:MAG: hypothetical protein EOP49_10690 [Sphingobacteriales bacterium]|nr:MAG: hypothetical protein EOP49_10690 [Sphingobacteriales bacterium]
MHPLWMVLAVVTLLYAMYIPYYWNLPMLKKVLQPLRQFRSPDRLSWIFYFIISVYTALVLDYLLTLFAARRKQMLGYVVVVPVLLIWFIDANGNIIYIHRASENLKANSDQFFMKEGSFKDFLEAKDWNPGSFQAILPLPYVSVGSEKLWMHENQTYAHDMAYRASLELHLPLMSVMMSRTSWSQTFRQVKIASGIYGSHPVLEEIGNKPLLLMVYPNDPLNPDEEEIVHSAALLGEAGGCRLYSFHPATFAERKQKAWKEALDIAASQRTQDSVIGDTTLLYIDHFDGHQSGFAFKDHNAAPAIKGWDSLAFVKDIPAQAIGQQFELSAWVKLPENNHRNCYFDVVCRDSGGKELYREHAFGKMSADNAPGFWFRLNHFFHIPEGSTRLEVYYFNEPDPNYLAVDQLMLRPAKTLIISKRNGAVFANNHLLQR